MAKANTKKKTLSGGQIADLEAKGHLGYTDKELVILADFYRTNYEYFKARNERIIAQYFATNLDCIEGFIQARKN